MFGRGSTLSMRQVDEGEPGFPEDRACKGGHLAEDGVRFFMVSGDLLPAEHEGAYCEECLAKANKLAAAQKKEKLPWPTRNDLQS